MLGTQLIWLGHCPAALQSGMQYIALHSAGKFGCPGKSGSPAQSAFELQAFVQIRCASLPLTMAAHMVLELQTGVSSVQCLYRMRWQLMSHLLVPQPVAF
jgi:hypothetical protein